MKFTKLCLLCCLFFLSFTQSQNLSSKTYKMVFFFKYKEILDYKEHPMLAATYKNILLSKDQMTIFASQSENSHTNDNSIDTSKYIYTIRYKFIPLLCHNHNFICKHAEFVKFYSGKYQMLKYDIPNEILKFFSSKQKAAMNCVILLHEVKDNTEDTAWVCHQSEKILFEFIVDISNRISVEKEESGLTFHANYIGDSNGELYGKTIVTKDYIKFIYNNNNIIDNKWSDINHFSYSLYYRDSLHYKNDNIDSNTCIRIIRNENNYEYLCLYSNKNDINPLNKGLSIFYSGEIYSYAINDFIMNSKVKQAQFAFNEEKVKEIDYQMIWPLILKTRLDFIKCRHIAIGNIKYKIVKNLLLEKELDTCKKESINRNCDKNENCIKIMNYAVKEKILKFDTDRYKIAYDVMNMYHGQIPNYKFIIDQNGNVKEDGKPFPNRETIVKMYSTLKKKDNCNSSSLTNSTLTIHRKLDLLNYATENDLFFNFLSSIQNYIK